MTLDHFLRVFLAFCSMYFDRYASLYQRGYPKMDGFSRGKSDLEMDHLGVALFQETSMCVLNME